MQQYYFHYPSAKHDNKYFTQLILARTILSNLQFDELQSVIKHLPEYPFYKFLNIIFFSILLLLLWFYFFIIIFILNLIVLKNITTSVITEEVLSASMIRFCENEKKSFISNPKLFDTCTINNMDSFTSSPFDKQTGYYKYFFKL